MASTQQQEVGNPSSAASAPAICVECRGKCDTCGGLISYRAKRRYRARGEPRPGGSGGAPRPARCTIHRRKTRALQDQELLQTNERYTWGGSKPGEPCLWCGKPRTLAGGHAFYKGNYFCPLNEDGCEEDGAGSVSASASASAWLQKQSSAMPQPTSRTTVWRQRKSQATEEQLEEARKVRKCAKCGLPLQAVYGHSSFMTKVPNRSLITFCTLHSGKPLALWLAEMRAREAELTRPQQQLAVAAAAAAATATQDAESPQEQSP